MFWWENSFLSSDDGELYLGGRKAREIARDKGTPLFIYSRKQILANYAALQEVFESRTSLEIRICYAMKANPFPDILKILKRRGGWIDAVSAAEVERALEAGFPAHKIIFTGTSLSAEDILRAFEHKGVLVNIDALEQLEVMKEIREKHFPQRDIRVSVRWNPGLGRGFSPGTTTAGSNAPDGTPVKFGIEEGKVISAFAKAVDYGFVPVALHQHLGSGWVREDLEVIKSAVDRIIHMASKIQNAGISLEFLDFGGGFGPRYSEAQEPFPLKEYAEHICLSLKESDLKIKAVALEPGKYLAGDAGVLLLRVEYLKKSYGNLFACVNGGTYNSVPRPAIYGQAYHHIVNAGRLHAENMAKVTVAGNLCETGDIFGKEILMPPPQRGEILAVLCAGAYCRSMASNFNLREIPPEIII